MKILVTGGAGFIGSHLCEKLIEDKNEVVCIDNFNDYYDPNIKRNNLKNLLNHSQFQLYEGDILNHDFLQSILREGKIDFIVHLAARAGVRPSLEDPRLYQKVNIEGTGNLLELSAQHGISKFVLASTSSVYGNNKKVPFSENDSVDHPISPYAATKKACELIAYTYHSLYKMDITCLRFFTVYGPRQRPDMAIHKFAKLIHEKQEIPMFGDGSSRRDYTYIDDIIDGVIKSMDNCKGYQIFNLGESQTIELRELIGLISSALGEKARIKQMPEQPGDVRITYADISKAVDEIGYRPTTSIQSGIPKFINWYLSTVK